MVPAFAKSSDENAGARELIDRVPGELHVLLPRVAICAPTVHDKLSAPLLFIFVQLSELGLLERVHVQSLDTMLALLANGPA